MCWALLRGLGWGLTLIPSPTTTHGQSGALPDQHWAGERAHTLSCCRACIPIHSLSISFTGESESCHSVCVVFLSFGLEKRWDFSEQILLSPSTLWVQSVTTWRINLLWKEGQSNTFGAALFPILEPVRDSPHRAPESQSGPEAQDGAGCPQSCQCPQATTSLPALVHQQTRAGSTEAEFTCDTDKLYLICCCSLSGSCWVLMIKVSWIFSFFLPS